MIELSDGALTILAAFAAALAASGVSFGLGMLQRWPMLGLALFLGVLLGSWALASQHSLEAAIGLTAWEIFMFLMAQSATRGRRRRDGRR